MSRARLSSREDVKEKAKGRGQISSAVGGRRAEFKLHTWARTRPALSSSVALVFIELNCSRFPFLPQNFLPVLLSSPSFPQMTHLKWMRNRSVDRNSLNILLPQITEWHTPSAFPPFRKYLGSVISTWVLNSILFCLSKKCVLSICVFSFLELNSLL